MEVPIREYHAKLLLSKYIDYKFKMELVNDSIKNDWKVPLVVKPDQCIGKKGKNNLLSLNLSKEQAQTFINRLKGKEVELGGIKGTIDTFLVEPYIEHEKEYYLSIVPERDGDRILLSDKGGIDIEDNWDSVKEIFVPVLSDIDVEQKANELGFPGRFVKNVYNAFKELNCTFLETNPFTIKDGVAIPLGLVMKLDSASFFKNYNIIKDIEIPIPFGKQGSEEENAVKELDKKSGASLKLTLLNRDGAVWPLTAGGGASVIFLDELYKKGYADDIAMYAEYSGNPSTDEMFAYTSIILDLLLKSRAEQKTLYIVGAIANFTDVKATFKGIINALDKYADKLKQQNIKIIVRRGGPNEQEGLSLIKEFGKKKGLNIVVYSPDEKGMVDVVE